MKTALGGSGSRGSGKVVFENLRIMKRKMDYYINGKDETVIRLNGYKSMRDIHKNFQIIFEDKKIKKYSTVTPNDEYFRKHISEFVKDHAGK